MAGGDKPRGLLHEASPTGARDNRIPHKNQRPGRHTGSQTDHKHKQ